MLGRVNVNEPVCSCSMASPWSTPSPTMDRITHRSSTHFATLGKRLLTGIPLWPCRLKSNGDLMRLPRVFEKAHSSLIGIGLPSSRSRRGLGSNESICETPPCMNRKLTRLARAGKCGFGGTSGSGRSFWTAALARVCSDTNPLRPSVPKLSAERLSRARLETGLGLDRGNIVRSSLLQLVHVVELVGCQQHAAQAGPSFQARVRRV